MVTYVLGVLHGREHHASRFRETLPGARLDVLPVLEAPRDSRVDSRNDGLHARKSALGRETTVPRR
jgi:hypothetical protein